MKIFRYILSVFPVSIQCLVIDWMCQDHLPLPHWASLLCQSNPELNQRVRAFRTVTSILSRTSNDWGEQFDLSMDTEFLKNIPLRHPLPISKPRTVHNHSLVSWITMASGATLTAWILLLNPLTDTSVPRSDSNPIQPTATLTSMNLATSSQSVRFPSKVVVPTGFLGIPARGIQEVSSAVKLSYQSELAQTLESTHQAVWELPKQIFPPDLRRSALNLYAQSDY